ncbi:MAG: thiamine transporter [Clostridiales bacterium]|nr:thiamine transporter [Clostridiales bacterium]
MRRIKRFLVSVLLPIVIAAAFALLFKTVYTSPEGINYLLMWICIGIPFGIHRMCIWLVPTKFDLAGTIGVMAVNIIVGGIIGGFAFVFQVLKGTVQTVAGT